MTALLVLTVLLLASCLHHVERKSGPSLRDIDAGAPVLKLHLASGELYVLSTWFESATGETILGRGQRWDPARRLLNDGQQVVRVRDVVIFETSSERFSIGPNAVMAGLTVVSAAAASLVLYIFFVFASSDNSR